jgi:hypothetical protein
MEKFANQARRYNLSFDWQVKISNINLQQIAFLLNTRRDVPLERLYRVLGFTYSFCLRDNSVASVADGFIFESDRTLSQM